MYLLSFDEQLLGAETLGRHFIDVIPPMNFVVQGESLPLIYVIYTLV